MKREYQEDQEARTNLEKLASGFPLSRVSKVTFLSNLLMAKEIKFGPL